MTCSWVLCVLRRGFSPTATSAAIVGRSALVPVVRHFVYAFITGDLTVEKV
jgi:hypothetical protein